MLDFAQKLKNRCQFFSFVFNLLRTNELTQFVLCSYENSSSNCFYLLFVKMFLNVGKKHNFAVHTHSEHGIEWVYVCQIHRQISSERVFAASLQTTKDKTSNEFDVNQKEKNNALLKEIDV